VGHLQVVTGLSDQLYRNAWSVLGEFWGRGAGRDLIIIVGAMVQSQPEDGPHIGPKHVVIILL